MSIFRRPAPPVRPQHPDPAVELKLRAIAAIDGLRSAAIRQIAMYQADLQAAQEDHGRATERMAAGLQRNLRVIEATVAIRVNRAEEGIRQQREVILGLGPQLDKAIADSGLTDADLSYLDLG